jgi:hypothetical protein
MTGTALAQSSVSLSWTPSVTPNTTVNVYRASSSCSNSFIRLASDVPAAGPYIAQNLLVGGTYAFQVTAVLNGVESPPSNCVVLTIPPNSCCPCCAFRSGCYAPID